MDVEAARWMREAPEHDPTPLRCSEWYSTTPSRNTLERAVVVLWYHCGTLRLAEIFSGAGSQQLSPTGTYTPTTQLTHQRHTATHPATRLSYPQVIHRLSTGLYTCIILHIGHPSTFQYSMLFFYNIREKNYCHSYRFRYNTPY